MLVWSIVVNVVLRLVACVSITVPAVIENVCACFSKMTAVGFEPTPLRNGALSHRLRPLGQTVLADWLIQFFIAVGQKNDLDPAQNKMTLAGLEPAIFGSEDQRLIH